MLILYGENERLFSSMGLGAIPDAVSCIVGESTDGSFELEMEYPVDGIMASQIDFRKIILALTTPLASNETFQSKAQPFRIYGIDDPIGGTFTVHASHISYDMSGYPVSPFTKDGETALDDAITELPNQIVLPNGVTFPFTITTLYHPHNTTSEESSETSEDNTVKKFELTTPSTVRSVLFSQIINEFEYCVWKFNRFSATLYSDGRDASRPDDAKRGANKGVVLRYGKHFTDITQERNNSLVVSGIYPFWGNNTNASKSVSALLLSGLQSFAEGSMNRAKIVELTGLTVEEVTGYINEYMSSDPHTVDLSAIGGKTTGGESTQTVTDTHTQNSEGTTTVFNLGYSFISITKITVNDKATNAYTYDETAKTVTFDTAPAANAKIKITGSVPGIVTLSNKIYAPENYTCAYTNVIPVDFSSEFSEAPTEADLLQKASEYWKDNNLGQPTVSITVTYNDPHGISEFMNVANLDNIELCDTIRVIFEEKGINRDVQVNKIEYDCLADRITSIDLGEPKKSLAKTIVEVTTPDSSQSSINKTSSEVGETLIETKVLYRRCVSKTDPPAVTETETDKWQETKPAATTLLPYLWQKTVKTYSTGRAESVDFVCIETGEATPATQAQIQTIYYLTNSSTPTLPTIWVESDSTSPNIWTRVVPSPQARVDNNPYVYYYLTQTKAIDGTISNGDISKQAMSDVISTWLYVGQNDSIEIEGTRLRAGSILANSIAANQLVANHISTNGLFSNNYVGPTTGNIFAQSGMKINFTSGSEGIISPGFVLDSSGDAYFKGYLNAIGGKIGNTDVDAIEIRYDASYSVTRLMFEQGEYGTGNWLTLSISRLGIEWEAGNDDAMDGFVLKADSVNGGHRIILDISVGGDFRSATRGSQFLMSYDEGCALNGPWTLDENHVCLGSQLLSNLTVPIRSASDYGKFLRANPTTGALEWADGGGGGGGTTTNPLNFKNQYNTTIMTFNGSSEKTIKAGGGIGFSETNNILTITSNVLPSTTGIEDKWLHLGAADELTWSDKPTYSYSEVGAAAAEHTHDDRYYTETEVNTLLNNKLDDYTIAITTGGGNPRPVKFLTVNYTGTDSNNSIFINLNAISCHPNGSAYKFLEEIIIGVTYTGSVSVDVNQTIRTSCGTWDGHEHYYGDVFYTVNSSTKIVDFYILCGQWSRPRFSPYKRQNGASAGTITQYSSASYYSSGTKQWAANKLFSMNDHTHSADDIVSGTLSSNRIDYGNGLADNGGQLVVDTDVIQTKIPANTYAAYGHTHDDRYYTETEVNTLLAGKAASSHNHDERYYTESEVNTLLAGKAASSHTHSTDDINSGTLDANRLNVGYGLWDDSGSLAIDDSVVQLKEYAVHLNDNQTITGLKTFTKGLIVSGRTQGSGDDEGIVVGAASNGFAGICLGNPTGERVVLYNILNTHTAELRHNLGSGTTYSLTIPNETGTFATRQWVNNQSFATEDWCWENFIPWSCLIEGTKIKMFDGTEKNIEDVEPGDSILTYDVDKHINIEGVVIGSFCTGKADDYKAYIFDDGKYAEFYGEHSIWNVEVECPKKISRWTLGEHGIAEELTNPSLVSVDEIHHPIFKRHYVLVTNNNLYYANGILMGHWSAFKYNIISHRFSNSNFPASLMEQYKTEAEWNERRNEFPISPDILSKSSTVLANLRSLTKQSDDLKEALNQSDYTVTKVAEAFFGKLKAIKLWTIGNLKDAFEAIKDFDYTDRDTMRKQVEALKPQIEAAQAEYDTIRKEHIKGMSRLRIFFRRSSRAGNQNVDQIKEWANNLKEKDGN